VSKPASVCLVEDTANRYKVNRGRQRTHHSPNLLRKSSNFGTKEGGVPASPFIHNLPTTGCCETGCLCAVGGMGITSDHSAHKLFADVWLWPTPCVCVRVCARVCACVCTEKLPT